MWYGRGEIHRTGRSIIPGKSASIRDRKRCRCFRIAQRAPSASRAWTASWIPACDRATAARRDGEYSIPIGMPSVMT
ncbi:MAG: hypothetical protein ABT15_12575 [Pseudonocardia sp. SCN 73-27]|nr:MAG: hypothetical protein ABS80_07590 [Pseudonocardia sp. SCN 72-51]ODV06343.1 MAG: hypothetical protein ABT15_12575 [Pseudonocardia sp. SCN 73-27]